MAIANTRSRFRKGDYIINKRNGKEAIVVSVPGDSDYDAVPFLDAKSGMMIMSSITGSDSWVRQDEWMLNPNYQSYSSSSFGSYSAYMPTAYITSNTSKMYVSGDLPDSPPEPKKPEPAKLDVTKLDKVVMDSKDKDEIIAVLKQHKNSIKLFEEWGIGEIIKYGKGMTFLFYGPPGTGKTQTATCIGEAVGKEVMSISSAEIQSSEPGGANRNIQNAFKEARSSGKVLFLDECDSLITSRSEVGMILGSEINTLLTEIEKFEGIVVLATNRIENLDEALERRISLIIEFKEPDEAARQKIWERMLPKKMPLGKGVGAKELAKHTLTGGQIKNVLLQAARMAVANECSSVDKTHFDSAIKRITASKSLMGSASRYRQEIVQDFVKSKSNVDVKMDIKKDFQSA